MIRIRKATHPADLLECNSMQATVFTEGEHRDIHKDHWWIAEVAGKPAGFACAKLYEDNQTLYLALAGVLPQYRGKGIQKRLIRAREMWGRKQGAKVVAVTYTAWLNWASANSLIRQGYTLYSPQNPWGLKWSLYFRKVLT